ncbi:hypothetical protein CC1G_06888 [Coprinopsis cinerea okayama7|uniref:Uncharacterized protein n=1 Tax=Coprinopsis cinerea (strain Okayama-7 / 130 / ATCC MYA-4618 / FGSC 9003) TaxID=240176 RepID=A8N716_COPC7|nr:hypothetical protein CC1G_06888 [Coprinopsis cinerea okayama7\|eukprot:XP_001830622.2 hypothetical protein CC1G_06888 [Coprinopsis cinerea okayama7\
MMPKHISQALAILVILVSSVNALAIGDVGAVHAAPEILAREVSNPNSTFYGSVNSGPVVGFDARSAARSNAPASVAAVVSAALLMTMI